MQDISIISTSHVSNFAIEIVWCENLHLYTSKIIFMTQLVSHQPTKLAIRMLAQT